MQMEISVSYQEYVYNRILKDSKQMLSQSPIAQTHYSSRLSCRSSVTAEPDSTYAATPRDRAAYTANTRNTTTPSYYDPPPSYTMLANQYTSAQEQQESAPRRKSGVKWKNWFNYSGYTALSTGHHKQRRSSHSQSQSQSKSKSKSSSLKKESKDTPATREAQLKELKDLQQLNDLWLKGGFENLHEDMFDDSSDEE
ncbi:hypothetical protein TBLA_0B01000 [Henningerozyma blattae CBS 6284]|uniref:Uncharacterized protein n=1 Tax=Henningerozyma blattae (strain ATCC 34711 / CBS 6284 / DSM 70876 / NBRC 10599 / NRRL Y-10934 / UCD 77-7) TaxID=1071380 RepID=I2GXU1_HENB6|nr:hypothetical protein TBLA_0B01000 [Tetrapisispora blattae CBS 6284]CCH58943.1 hypothetical protein TBLA_0B01000 [Tetrapisispora blattae CBS 6284]